MFWSFHHLKNFPQFVVIHTVKDFRVVKEAEVSLDLSCFLYDSVKVKSLSHVGLFATPWTLAYHAPPLMEFSRQEYWSGLPSPSPGDQTQVSCIVGRRFTIWATREALDVGNLISGSSAFSKSSLIIWKFLVHIVLKPGSENFELHFASMCNECNFVVV